MLDNATTARPRARPGTASPPPSPNAIARPRFAPPPDLAELTYNGMIALNRRTAGLAKTFRLAHQQWRERVLLYELSASEFVVLTAIVCRTFSWGKLIESIALDQFKSGMRNKSGGWQETNGVPTFQGTGLDRKTTIKALNSLHERGLITRFAYPYGGRETSAWAPLSARTILRLVDYHDDIFLPLIEARRLDDRGEEIISPLEADFHARFTSPVIREDQDE